MNHRPICSQCKSEDLEPVGKPIKTAGRLVYPRRCRKCGFFWSANEPLTLPPPEHKSKELAPVLGEPPVNAPLPVAEPPVAPAAPVVIVPAASAAPAAPAKAKAKANGKAKGSRKGQQQP